MCLARKKPQPQAVADPAAAAPLLAPPAPEQLPTAIGIPQDTAKMARRDLRGGWRSGLTITPRAAY